MEEAGEYQHQIQGDYIGNEISNEQFLQAKNSGNEVNMSDSDILAQYKLRNIAKNIGQALDENEEELSELGFSLHSSDDESVSKKQEKLDQRFE